MGLTFYPIENVTVLQVFRQRLSPFMRAVQKTTTSEYITEYGRKESICDEVINAARPYNGDDQLSVEWYQYIRDTSNRTLLRHERKCKSFQWYLANVYPEQFVPEFIGEVS